MIDHVTVTVKDLEASRAFYAKALAPLGYAVKLEFPKFVGFGDARKPYFWLKDGETPTTPQHLAFRARSRAAVDAFHAAALAAGARDDGAPGVREMYHPSYYGAFVVDPINGHPIEAVCHAPPAPEKKKAAKKRARKKAAVSKRKTKR